MKAVTARGPGRVVLGSAPQRATTKANSSRERATTIEVCVIQRVRLGGACGPPPPFVAPLVPRCALTSGATPRVRAGRRLRSQLASTRRAREGHGDQEETS